MKKEISKSPEKEISESPELTLSKDLQKVKKNLMTIEINSLKSR